MDDSGLFFFFLPASRTCLSSHTEACGVNQTVLSSYLFVDVRNLHRDKNCHKRVQACLTSVSSSLHRTSAVKHTGYDDDP